MALDAKDGSVNQDGAEPIYGPAYGAVHPAYGAAHMDKPQPGESAGPQSRSHVEGVSPRYTAPYPPYPSDVPAHAEISAPVASGLAYFIVPAVFFLVSEPYRSTPLVRFHSWQAIFYFLAVAAVRVVEMLVLSMMPSNIAFSISSLVSIALFLAWLIAAIKAFQGGKWMLPVIGSYAAQTASTVSTR